MRATADTWAAHDRYIAAAVRSHAFVADTGRVSGGTRP
jgi:hypothetical protein